VAGFILECLAGFIGIRTRTREALTSAEPTFAMPATHVDPPA
jgi:hypothetical protein